MATLNNVSGVSLTKIGIKWGLIICAAMVAYFFFMHEMDMIRHTGWRFINYAIIAVGMYMSLKEVKRKDRNHRTDYLPGMGILFVIAIVSSLAFGIFMVLYSAIDMNFIPLVSNQIPHWGPLTPIMIGFQISSEIFLICTILNLTVLMLFKRNTRSNINKTLAKNKLSY